MRPHKDINYVVPLINRGIRFKSVRVNGPVANMEALFDNSGHYYVYVLECEDDHFYVGLTDHPYRRLDQHFHGRGSNWTRAHHPIVLKALYQVQHRSIKAAIEVEKEMTWWWGFAFGFDKVRGALGVDTRPREYICGSRKKKEDWL